ncbi:hypothetical protein L7F22_008303 [Adiantum nelumboides]|nr:hypothetical protein [Adiantum nelumboides]
MVLNGIQPPENMQQTATASPPGTISTSIPIPFGGRAALALHRRSSVIGPAHTTYPQIQNSAFSLSGLCNNVPQRSAGSFNMVHPLILTQLMGSQTSTPSTKVPHDDDNDVLVSCSGKPPADVRMSSSSSSSSPSFLSNFINTDSSWELHQPLHTYPTSLSQYSTDHLQSCELLLQPRKRPVVTTLAFTSACASNITRIGSAESMSTASSGWTTDKGWWTQFSQLASEHQLSGKQPGDVSKITISQREKLPESMSSLDLPTDYESTPSLDIDRGLCLAEEEYGSLAYCLQGDFWAHPEGTLCDCTETLFEQEDVSSMHIDDMIFDIPMLSAPSSATNMKVTGAKLVVDQAAKKHSDCIMTSSLVDLVIRDGVEDCGFGKSPSPAAQADGSSGEWRASSTTSMRADEPFNQVNARRMMPEMVAHTKSATTSTQPSTSSSECNIQRGRPSLVRSCSLNVMPLTNQYNEVEQDSSLLRASGLLSDMGLVQSRKRSFSASELNSDYDQPELLVRKSGDNIHAGNKMQLSPTDHVLKQQAMVQQQGDDKNRIPQGQIIDEITVGQYARNIMLAKKESSLVQMGTSCEEVPICMRKELLEGKSNVCGISDYEVLEGGNSVCGRKHNHKQEGNMNVSKQQGRRRRHGTATDPQSIAARSRREKFSEKIRMLQSLVPNGERLDTVSMLGQTLEYIRFLQHQVWELYHGSPPSTSSTITNSTTSDNIWKQFMQGSHASHDVATSTTTSP